VTAGIAASCALRVICHDRVEPAVLAS